jgi:hypothetical protein
LKIAAIMLLRFQSRVILTIKSSMLKNLKLESTVSSSGGQGAATRRSNPRATAAL